MKRPRKRGSSVAVIDIGSNSVRLVVYEGLARSLIPIFNEKTLCGLGREGCRARACSHPTPSKRR
ncbi:exopolyphosphatase/pppGpp-phosphohydrolase [Bradyrhizobium sp. LM6.10]